MKEDEHKSLTAKYSELVFAEPYSRSEQTNKIGKAVNESEQWGFFIDLAEGYEEENLIRLGLMRQVPQEYL